MARSPQIPDPASFMGEASFQQWCMSYAQSHHVLAIKVAIVGRRGYPDLQLKARHTGVYLVELKHPNGSGRVRPYQKQMHTRLRRYGYDVRVISKPQEFADLIHEIMEVNLVQSS